MYYNKKRMNIVVLLGVIMLLGVCGCNTVTPVQEEKKQVIVTGDVTEKVEKDSAKITKTVMQDPIEIMQAVAKVEEGTAGEIKPTETVEPEELVLHVLTNAEGVYVTGGGVGMTELLGYVEENDIAYFIMKKQKGLGELEPRSAEVYVGVLNPATGELLQHYCYGNTIADAVMIEKETGLYIVYATECCDYGLHSGYGGVLLAKDGTLTQVWPLTAEGTYDDDYWNGHTVRLNGETLERYKVIVTEVSPGDTAICTEAELEQAITLEDILAGAV